MLCVCASVCTCTVSHVPPASTVPVTVTSDCSCPLSVLVRSFVCAQRSGVVRHPRHCPVPAADPLRPRRGGVPRVCQHHRRLPRDWRPLPRRGPLPRAHRRAPLRVRSQHIGALPRDPASAQRVPHMEHPPEQAEGHSGGCTRHHQRAGGAAVGRGGGGAGGTLGLPGVCRSC